MNLLRLLPLLLACAWAPPLYAQESQPAAGAEPGSAEPGSAVEEREVRAEGAAEDEPKGPPQELQLSLTGWQRFEARSRLDDGPARLSVYRTGFDVRASRFFGFFGRGSVSAGYEWSRYDLQDATNLDPPRPRTEKDPWDRLHVVRLRLEGQLFLSRSFFLSTFVSGRLGFEEGTDLADAFTAVAFLLAGWRISPDFQLLFGAGTITQLEDSPNVFPALGVRWKVTDWLRLDLLGPLLRATFTPTEGLELFLSVAWQNRQYRFAKRRSLFAEHILQDGQLRVQAAARWFVSDFLALRAELGVIAYRELELLDPRGDDVYRLQGEPALLGGLGLELRF